MVTPKIPSVLVGVWTLLNNTPTDLTGQPITTPVPLGTHPVGLLHYSAAGYMSANLASTLPANRPAGLTWPAQAEQSDADWATVGRETLAYAGEFSVSEGSNSRTGTAFHGPLSVAHTPSWTGTTQLRNYTVYEEVRDGTTKTILRLWQRIEISGIVANIWWEKIA